VELVGPIAVGLTRAVSRIDVSGTNHLPYSGPAIVAVNHTTIVDVAPVLAALYRAGLRPSRPCGGDGCETTHIRFLATEFVFANPILGPLVRHAGFVPVGGGRGAAGALKAGLAALARGEIVGIYPEGDVAATDDGAPRRFRVGVSKLAMESGATIVPVAHHDARQIGSGSVARSLVGAVTSIVRRPTVRIRVGAQIKAAEYAGRTIAETAALVHERVTAVWRSLAGTPDEERQAG
jgi:1-acyl-sn-glycerol-3-phosphate acyltransferase